MVRTNPSKPALREIYSALFRHRRKALSFFLAVMTAVILITFLSPRIYRSEGTLFVRLGRENMTPDPTVTLGQGNTVSIYQSRENEINSVAEILQSRSLIEKVVDKLGAATVLGGKATASQSRSRRDKAVLAVAKNLKVWPVRKSSVIQITYEGRSPRLSQTVLQTLIDCYLEEHGRLNRPPGTHEFLAEQTDRLRDELNGRENELRDLKSRTGLISAEDQRKILVERVGRLEDEVDLAAAAVASHEAEADAIRGQLDGMSPLRVSSQVTGMTNQGTDGMREQLYALRIKEQEASAKYTEEHPKMQELRRQVAAAKALLAKEEPTRTHVTTGPNEVYQQGQLTLLAQEPVLSSLRAKAGVLRQQLLAARAAVRTLNQNEMQIAKLQREIDLFDANYRKYSANLEQARVDQALQVEQMSNIEVVQGATYDAKPVRPRKRVNLALGLFVAVAGAIGLALLLEYGDHSLRSPEDVEKNLQVPMLVSIPCLHRKQLIQNGRN